MFGALKDLFAGLSGASAVALREPEQHQLHLAVAGLLHEMTRVDLKEKPEERAAAVSALRSMFGLDPGTAAALLEQAGAQRFTSYFGPVSIIKRLLPMASRIALVEHLWLVAFSDAALDAYEDHFVRKIAHLLYVTNTECMLARQRARRH